MTKRTLYIAAYDVRCAKRLRAMLQILKGYSTGGQKSVFECFLTASEQTRLIARVEAVIDLEEDSFLMTALDPRSKVETLGVAVPPTDPPYYYAG